MAEVVFLRMENEVFQNRNFKRREADRCCQVTAAARLVPCRLVHAKHPVAVAVVERDGFISS